MPLQRLLPAVASVVLLMSACAPESPSDPLAVPSPDAAAPEVGGGIAVVLPPAGLLAAAERDHVRRAVERAFAIATPEADDPARIMILEPADDDAVVDAVERAVRRVGPGGTVCVLGAGVRDRIAALLVLYPATRACLLPASPVEGDVHLTADVDLDALGRAIGEAARTAAGDGTVLVVAAGDPMLDQRWRTGVVEAVLAGGEGRTPGRVHVVGSADDALRLLDEQAALIAEGIVPGSPAALGSVDGSGVSVGLDEEFVPAALVLPPVAAVVLDASPDAVLLLPALAERDLLVVGPRSLLASDGVRQDTVVLRWRIRWHLPLSAMLDVALDGGGTLPDDEVLVLEMGPAGGG